MKRLVGLVVLVGAFALASRVEAAPILGGIAFKGKATPIGGPSPVQYATSTGVNFQNPWQVTSTSGSYTPVPIASPATFNSPLNWGSGSGNVNLVVGPLTVWTFSSGGLTYALSIGTINTITRGTPGNISVLGSGTLTITGGLSNFDPTPGTWGFTGSRADIVTFTSAAQAPVPEPGSMLLLGTGLLGLATAARRRFTGKV